MPDTLLGGILAFAAFIFFAVGGFVTVYNLAYKGRDFDSEGEEER